MPLSDYARDAFVSQDLSRITEANAEQIGVDFPEHQSWLTNYVLNRIFGNGVSEDRVALGFALLRQAEAAVEEYDLGCSELCKLVTYKKTTSVYFRCLGRFENAIGATYRAFDFARKTLDVKLFSPYDGSPVQRLNELYNVGRHYDPSKLPRGHLHAVWISNVGLHCTTAVLTFAEIRDLVTQVARLADRTAKGRK